MLWNTSTTIGIRIPKVPHEVPVAKAIRQPTINITAGRKFIKLPETDFMATDTNSFAPRISVIPFNVHANVRIRIAGTIDLNPSGIQSMQLLKSSTFLTQYKNIVTTSAKKLPSASPTDASLCEKAVIKSSPEKNPPV